MTIVSQIVKFNICSLHIKKHGKKNIKKEIEILLFE
jgi:hypothetical protein